MYGYGYSLYNQVPFGRGGAVPINSVAPVISGTQTVGQTLTSTTGTWTGIPAPTFTYQWYRGASLISGATASTYVLVQADAGNTTAIKCVVTATNSAGVASADSNILTGILDANAAAYLTATGITGTTQRNAVNTLNIGLKADGLWSKMKAVYPFVTDNKNLLSFTNAFGNSYYITDGTSSFTANNTTAPDGTNTGTRFTAIASNNNYFYSANTAQGQSFGTGNKAYSIYVKAGTFSGNVFLSITSDGNTQTTSATLTNEWQRITVTKNVIVAGNGSQYYIDLGGASMTSGQFFYIWGAQFENGTSATTYQPIATTQQAYIASQFKFNLVNPVDSDAAFRLVFNGGWTHSSNGATPNGTNGYADTKFNTNTNQTVNNFSLSVYVRTATQGAGSQCDIGNANSAVAFLPLTHVESTSITTRGQYCWDYNTAVASIATSDSRGMWGTSRSGASSWQSFERNTSVAKTTTTSQTTLPNLNLGIGASIISTGGGSTFSARQVAFAHCGDSLTNTEFNNLYTRVQAFQTALNRQV